MWEMNSPFRRGCPDAILLYRRPSFPLCCTPPIPTTGAMWREWPSVEVRHRSTHPSPSPISDPFTPLSARGQYCSAQRVLRSGATRGKAGGGNGQEGAEGCQSRSPGLSPDWIQPNSRSRFATTERFGKTFPPRIRFGIRRPGFRS